MITKKEIEKLLKERYIWNDDKIINIDYDKKDVSMPIWVLVRSKSGCITFYDIHDYGTKYQKVYKGYVSLSNVETWLLKY